VGATLPIPPLMTPSISGASLAIAYNTGLTTDQAIDEHAAGAAAAPHQPTPQPERPAAPAGQTSAAGHRNAASFNLETLAAAVGLDPDELLNQVKSGQGVSDLLGQAGEIGYGSTVRDSLRGGIVFDEYV
jgi:hypothetical protein